MKSENIYKQFDICDAVFKLGREAETEIKKYMEPIEEVSEINELKVIRAMQESGISSECMLETTGYGYNDIGRDKLEEVYARIFGTEDSLVRSQVVCGTHALTLALFGNLFPGDEIFSPVGLPYDTIQSVIGIGKNPARGSLKEYGIGFSYADLLPHEDFDYEAISKGITKKTRLISIQRSRGYARRRSFSVDEIGRLISFIRSLKKDAIILVDNCYGEYTETIEPTEVGADMAVGSLIKNPGGGIAKVGGYIVGSSECVGRAASRLTAPGLEKEVGPSLGNNLSLYQGTFTAPKVTAEAMKGAVFASWIYQYLGFDTSPGYTEKRHDIIEAITLKSKEKLMSFCKGIQSAGAVDSFVTPVPSPMPGYDSEIIMAGGSFISGSSIELSSDGPFREPYTVFFQGGLNYTHAKLGILMSVQQLLNDGLIKL